MAIRPAHSTYFMDQVTNRPSLILVVDDEAAVRRLVCAVLEQAGHSVAEAASGEEALGLLHSETVRPELMLTDIVMPGMNGIALAAHAHRIAPSLHVVFMSGFTQDYAAELTGSVCLAKPFKPAQLLSAVHSALALRA